MDETTLKDRLPQTVAARVRSLKLRDGTVTAILDGSGLDARGPVSYTHLTLPTIYSV